MNTYTEPQARYLPTAQLVRTMGGRELVQLVNWQDYKGWECRLDGVTIGYVHQHEEDSGDKTWVAVTNWGHQERNWLTLMGAVTYIVNREKGAR